MILKYNIEINDKAIHDRIKFLINQVYKLLPLRQQGDEWQRLLENILQELAGIQRLMQCGYSEIFFPLFSKLQGLYTLTQKDSFFIYRRTIFQCLSLMGALNNQICPYGS